jgi:hypothetical protein
MSDRPIKIPLRAVLIDLIGALLCALGIYALLVAQAVPWLLAVALIVLGIALMLYGMITLVRRLREQQRE